MQLRKVLSAAVLAAALQSAAFADTLVIDAVEAGAGVERPGKGETMASVEARFGKPQSVIEAVGQPPITRWVYDGFTVYFEGDRTLHSVVHR